MRWQDFQAVTFDCYGTLVDWEAGILAALRPLRRRAAEDPGDDALLAWFAAAEASAESGPYRTYVEVLGEVTESIASDLQVPLAPGERGLLADSIGRWPVFPDTATSLVALRGRYRLGVLSNIDDALFERTRPYLGADIDWLVTAEQVGSYKPDPRNFARLLDVVGLPPARVLHVAQSLYHDIGPARAAGMSTVWIDRRAGHGGGATPKASANPDLRCGDLSDLVAAMRLSD